MGLHNLSLNIYRPQKPLFSNAQAQKLPKIVGPPIKAKFTKFKAKERSDFSPRKIQTWGSDDRNNTKETYKSSSLNCGSEDKGQRYNHEVGHKVYSRRISSKLTNPMAELLDLYDPRDIAALVPFNDSDYDKIDDELLAADLSSEDSEEEVVEEVDFLRREEVTEVEEDIRSLFEFQGEMASTSQQSLPSEPIPLAIVAPGNSTNEKINSQSCGDISWDLRETLNKLELELFPSTSEISKPAKTRKGLREVRNVEFGVNYYSSVSKGKSHF